MKWLVVIVAIVVAAIVAYRTAYPSVTVRYRLTLEVQVNGKPTAGSSVGEVTYARNLRLFGASADIVAEVRGEAASVALDKGGLLVALLEGGSPRTGPAYVIPKTFGLTDGGVGPGDIPKLSALAGKRDVPMELLPPLIRFRDVNDPTSVEIIGPSSSSGPLKFDRASIEIVNAGYWPLRSLGLTGVPLSHELGSKLPWLGDKSRINLFWRALYAAGFRPNGSVEPLTLLIRGS
jgi:hypothetical protein